MQHIIVSFLAFKGKIMYLNLNIRVTSNPMIHFERHVGNKSSYEETEYLHIMANVISSHWFVERDVTILSKLLLTL